MGSQDVQMFDNKNLVILTGAGISAESGLKTFRGEDGLWEGHRVEDVATPEAFFRSPELVHKFYNLRRRQLKEVMPNIAHRALVELEQKWKGQFLLVTQNVDDLHERAGSKKLLHMHGELNKVRCDFCDNVQVWKEDLSNEELCSNCKQKGKLRPHIVWFGEMPFYMDEIFQELEGCTHFVAIGTSGLVYPAAGFVQMARRAEKIEVNLEKTQISGVFHKYFIGHAGEQVPKLVDYLLSL